VVSNTAAENVKCHSTAFTGMIYTYGAAALGVYGQSKFQELTTCPHCGINEHYFPEKL
jgi:hypothetical protein